ncbi:MAG: cyclophilin-like fold protein [Dysgonomonas sp.]|nr:cyclophilin-like fold protein [Dysgonomonas sp.]
MKKLSKYILISLLSITMPIGVNSCSNDGINSEAELPSEIQDATLTYKINGADNGSEPETITEKQGTIITLDNGTGFSRTEYIFAGWNTAADGSGTDYTAGSKFTLTSDIILYAKWNRVGNSSNTLKITVGSSIFTATLASNATATAFKQLLPITIHMSELNSNEKYYGLANPLPTNASNPGTIQNGDLMLYGSNTLVLFYKTFSSSYSYTRIGRIDDPSGLQNALGTGSATVIFQLQE